MPMLQADAIPAFRITLLLVFTTRSAVTGLLPSLRNAFLVTSSVGLVEVNRMKVANEDCALNPSIRECVSIVCTRLVLELAADHAPKITVLRTIVASRAKSAAAPLLLERENALLPSNVFPLSLVLFVEL